MRQACARGEGRGHEQVLFGVLQVVGHALQKMQSQGRVALQEVAHGLRVDEADLGRLQGLRAGGEHAAGEVVPVAHGLARIAHAHHHRVALGVDLADGNGAAEQDVDSPAGLPLAEDGLPGTEGRGDLAGVEQRHVVVGEHAPLGARAPLAREAIRDGLGRGRARAGGSGHGE